MRTDAIRAIRLGAVKRVHVVAQRLARVPPVTWPKTSAGGVFDQRAANPQDQRGVIRHRGPAAHHHPPDNA
jgi:hypothetical protein